MAKITNLNLSARLVDLSHSPLSNMAEAIIEKVPRQSSDRPSTRVAIFTYVHYATFLFLHLAVANPPNNNPYPHPPAY
jgi:hypothetical protein